MPEKAVHIYIEGRVQGVWFRGWTAQQADRLGLTGWVRNLRDGRVEAVLAGKSADVETMLALCRSGPPLARVDHVAIADADAAGLSGFEKRPTI